jgi:hypothetical protein
MQGSTALYWTGNEAADRPYDAWLRVPQRDSLVRFGAPSATTRAPVSLEGPAPLQQSRPTGQPRVSLARLSNAGTTAGKPASQMTDEELMAIIGEGQAKEAEERKPSN